MQERICRFCGTELDNSFVNLGMSPLSNSYIKPDRLNKKENYYPLHVYICSKCFLAQLEEFEPPKEIFGDYAYFSSYSDSWLNHVKQYTENIISRFKINCNHQIIEIASNDGYLLQYFKEKNISVLGVEPATNVAVDAEKKGIPTITEFFSKKIAEKLDKEGKQADLLIGNNVLAHVPNLNDFVSGMKVILKPQGIITMEFPHLLKLLTKNQFDTIYHEHFSYFSFITVDEILKTHRLTIFDVQELPTHGGSLRIYVKHDIDRSKNINEKVYKLIQKEKNVGLHKIETYKNFEERVKSTKRNILEFLINAKNQGKKIVGYGAPAKGNTLLNYCGIGIDFIDYTVDINPYKQGLYLPGSHIPILSPKVIKETKPEYVVILPWNLKEEIMEQLNYVKDWGGKFVIFIPNIEVF